MTAIHDDKDEEANNRGVIEELAQATKRPIAEVKEVYEAELARLKSDARIADYLPLFASRRARARLSNPVR